MAVYACRGGVLAAALTVVGACSDPPPKEETNRTPLGTSDAAAFPSNPTDGAPRRIEPDPANLALVEDTCVVERDGTSWKYSCPGTTPPRSCIDMSGLGIQGSHCTAFGPPCPVCLKDAGGSQSIRCPPGEGVYSNFSYPVQIYCAPKQ